ncbi:MAG: formyltransferase family protein [Planctomycetota bacterium]|jgi:methionyl-tRNA formyltransferase
MNFGLFAADEVGYEIAKFFRGEQEPVSCLVLDSNDAKGLNGSILSVLDAKEVLYSDALYEETTLEKLRNMHIDLIILAWWPYILKESLIRVPRLGCLNFHPSYLPNNRGKHPYFWSIVEGVPFGVTLHFVDGGIDTGDTVFQETVEKSWEDAGSTLYERAKVAIVDLFKSKFGEIRSGNLPRKKQASAAATFHLGNEIEQASRIDLDQEYKARNLLNLLRARSNFPQGACWFVDDGHKYEVRVDIRKVPH